MPKTSIKILLIEDSPTDALLLKEALNNDPLADFQVTVAEQLKQGLAKLAAAKFDALLLDLGLPDSQGLQTFEKAHAQFPDMPMIVLSGLTDETLALQAVQSGAQDYLVKGEAGWNLGPRAIRYAIERFQNQSAMRASEARFSTVFHSSPTSIAITRISDNKILEVNEAWTEITGYSSVEVVGRVLGEINLWAHPEEREQIVNLLRRDGVVHGFEIRIRRKSGQLACMLFSAELIEVAGEPCMLSMALDITERKQAERALVENETKLKEAERNANLGYYDIDTASGKTIWSEETYRIFGLKPGEYDPNVGDYNQYLHQDDTQKVFDLYDESVKECKPFDLTYRIVRPNGEIRHVHSKSTFIADEQNNPTRLFGTIQDVTERVQAEKALRDSEEKFRNFIEQSTDGLIIADEQGVVIESNHALEKINEIPREQALGMTVWDIQFQMMLSENRSTGNLDVFRNHLQMAIQTGQSPYFGRTYEAAIRTKSGERKTIQQASFPIKTEKGYRIGAIIRDVTERKQAEEALKDSEARFRTFIEQSSDGLMIADEQGVIIEWNHALEKINEIPKEQALGMTVWDIQSQVMLSENRSPGNLDMFRSHLQTAVQTGQSPFLGRTYETAIQIKSGERKIIQQTSFPIKTEKGYRIGAIIRDVTERKQVEEKLRESEEHYRLLFENSPIGIYRTTPAGDILAANPALVRMLGYSTAGELFTRNLEQGDAVSTYSRALFKERVEREGRITGLEAEWHRHDGTPIFVRENAQVVRDESGAVLYYEGTIEDITERKQAEDKLRKLSRAVEQSPTSIVITDVQGNIEYVNPKFSQVTGYSMEEVLGQNPRFLKSDYTTREEYKKMWETITSGNIWQGEFLNKKKDGGTYWEIATIAPVFSDDGKITNFLAMKENITEQRQAENRLQLRESYLTAIIENQPGLVWLKDKDSRFLTVNTAFALSCGRTTPEEVAGKTDLEVWPTELAQKYKADDVSLMSGKKPTSFEEPIFDQGQMKWFETFKTPVFDEAGNIIGTAGYAQDVTERKLAEENLRESEERYRQLFENASIGVLLADAQGNILEVNPAALRILGSPTAEATRKINILNFPPLIEAGISAEFQECAQTAQPISSEHPYTSKWGKFIYMNLRVTPLVEANGKTTRVQILLEDITERKQAEEALRLSEANLNRAQSVAHVGSWNLDITRNILSWSAETYRIFGVSPEKPFTYESFLNHIYPDDMDFTNRSWQAALQGAPYDIEHRILADGEVKWVRERAELEADAQGNFVRAIGTVQDITARKQAEELRLQAEENYRNIFENAMEGIFQSLPEGRFITVNPAFARMLGYASPNKMIETITDIASQVYVESPHRAEFMRVMAERGSVTGFEFQMKRKDGGVLWVSESARAVCDNTGKLLYYEGSVENITERKLAEKSLQESESRYRLLFDEMLSGVAVHDIICDPHGKPIDYRFAAINAAFEKMTGLKSATVIGKTVLEVMPATESLWIERYGQVALTRIPIQFEEYSNELGKYFEVRAFSPEQGKFATIFNDITERKRAEDALAASEAKLRTLIEQVPTVVYSESAETRETVYISPQVEKLTGYSPAEWIEDHDMWKKIIHPADLAAVLAEDELTSENCEPFQCEYRVMTRDGRTVWIYDEAVMIKSQDGTPLFWQGVMYDVTERKQAEEKLDSAREFLQSVQDALSSHISILDHEGNIVQVNSAWRKFGAQNGLEHPNHCIGMNYLDICESAKNVNAEEALITANAIREVLSGKKQEIWLEYPCDSLDEQRWFVERITGFENNGQQWVVVSHENITTRKQAEEDIRQRALELELLYENGLVFSQLLNPKEIGQKVIELLGEKLNWHHTAIRLTHESDKSLELLAFDQPGLEDKTEESRIQEHLKKSVSNFGEGLSGWALQQSKTLRIGDVNSDPHYVASYPGIHSGLYVPLKSGDRALGVISIESEHPNAFSETDERLITTLANQAANAFENARLYQEVNRYTGELEQRVRERTTEIESTRQRLELAVKTAGIGIWELDVKQNKDYWDDGLFSLYGLSKENALPSPQTWHNSIHPDDLLQQLKLMEETLHNNQPYNSEFRVIWPDASIHHIKSTGIVIRDAEGQPERMIGANQDITLHKHAEETLRLANAEMERGLRIKNEFMANMSHELRTPLNAILGISESLEEQRSSTLDKKQLKYVRIIIESGRHLLDMINDILDLSKIEAGKLELNVQSTSVEKLCTSSLRMVRELAQKKSQNISFKLDEKVKVILGDERRLKQSLVNLLGNAVKFTPPGKKIGLEVSGNAEANEVTFTVWDEGIGIGEEDIQRLFKPFVQLNAGLAREYSGTGLGLALVAQMARLHGGRINLTSKLKLGSRFMLTLPWMPEEQAVQPPPKLQALAGSSKPDRKHTGKILIVDDVEMAAELIGEYLRNRGYETFVAGDGLEAVSIAKQEHPQMILMDVMMPEMSGIEATKQIRADDSLRDVLIIGLTALAMPEDREQCLAAGMNDHLSKPIQMQELLQIIERYLP